MIYSVHYSDDWCTRIKTFWLFQNTKEFAKEKSKIFDFIWIENNFNKRINYDIRT